jgi:hypothetical protein
MTARESPAIAAAQAFLHDNRWEGSDGDEQMVARASIGTRAHPVPRSRILADRGAQRGANISGPLVHAD